MGQRYSIFSLARHAASGHRHWRAAWRTPTLGASYDAVVVGGGGHGLATAYYLAANHGMTRVAVIERGWIGGGNTGRNTTVIRSNYLRPESMAIYELSRRLYETLSQELNYNVMFSPRGLLTLCQTEHELRGLRRTAHANRLAGIEAHMISAREAGRLAPILDVSSATRYPILGAYYQPRGGTARHDAVAWGYARAADRLGVDIVQDCSVTRLLERDGKIVGVETDRGIVKTPRVAVVAAAASSKLIEGLGISMPIESVSLQAFVSEPVKPILDSVIMSNMAHFYVSQSDKGEMVIGGGTDPYLSWASRGSWTAIEHTVRSVTHMIPILSRLKMLRHWAGTVDMTADRSPILSDFEVEGLFVNCGWGTGGFKAIPGSGWIFAECVASGRLTPVAERFSMRRFREGRSINESVAAAVAH